MKALSLIGVPIIMRAANGTFVEVSEWKSAEAVEAAHENPNVLALWEKLDVACDFILVKDLPEAAELFAGFTPIDA